MLELFLLFVIVAALGYAALRIEDVVLGWRTRKERRKENAWRDWYRAHPCRSSDFEPWRKIR
jgi:hypothetical protein